MISKEELTMGRDKQYATSYTKQVDANLEVLLVKINVIRSKYGKPMTVTSGWRPAEVNSATPNAAKASKHISGLAVDILDADHKLFKWCLQNLQIIQELGLYLEDKNYTKIWTHFQIGAPKSGSRIFKPGTEISCDAWDGMYDKKYDKI